MFKFVADGDVNVDGEVNVIDILQAQRYILGLNTLTQVPLDHGDFVPPPLSDGILNLGDLIIITNSVMNTQ